MEGTALQKQYASGEVAVRFNQNIRTMTNFLSMKYAYFNGVDVEYIGYPTNGANGSAIIPIESLAITTSCKTPDGAWEFLTHCLDCMYEDWAYTPPETFDGSDYVVYPELEAKAGFSCEKRTVERMFDTLSHYYYTVQEIGASVDDNYTSYHTWVTHLDVNGGWRKNREDGANFTLSEADRADFLRLLDTVTLVRSFDTALMDIIYEDASYYFNGTKSLEETVKIIENRVKIKLAE